MLQMSDLLSQYLILRFGQNSYERAIPSDSTLVQHQSIQKFSKSSSPFVFLATPDTCGLGMCLPSVNLVVVYDSSPDPSNELLATGRARKIGNSSELPIIRLFAENSVEEKVLHLAERRENGLEALLGAVHTRGTAGRFRSYAHLKLVRSRFSVLHQHASSISAGNPSAFPCKSHILINKCHLLDE